MAVFNIAAFFICLIMLSYFWEKKLVEILPVLTCMLVFILYALALIGHLRWINGVALVIITAFVIWLIRIQKEKRTDFYKTSLKNMTHVSFATALILIICVIFCTSQKVVTWWDDINFWATDVKSLYYLDGFASKYGNVAPEFGDYPPGTQLIKWWFLHFNPAAFHEGLAFAGYYTMNIAFMLPLLRNLKGKNVFIMFLTALSLWFLPSIAEVYGYNGFCADLTLACIYGGFLFAVTDRSTQKSENFYYIRLALYLGVLVLVKSVGFIWAAFGLVFFFAYQIAEKNVAKLKGVAVAATPFIMGGSWMLFCLIMRRVTKTTATAVKYITTDEYSLSGYMGDYAKAFLNAFVKLPLHQETSSPVNLTPLAFYICICLIVIFFYRKGLMPKRQGRIVLLFSIISGALFYAIIFIAHITIFANETQYLEAAVMISSIERYGAPFTIGTLILLTNIWIEYGGLKKDSVLNKYGIFREYGTYLVLILFVELTAGYKSGYYGLVGYHNDVEEHLADRNAVLDEDALTFLRELQTIDLKHGDASETAPSILSGTRVCYVQRDDKPRWVRNSYTNFEASPVSVVYKSVNLNDTPADWMAQEIRDTHAFYLYVEDTNADAAGVFDEMMAEGTFSCEKLYKIEDDGVQMRLSE